MPSNCTFVVLMKKITLLLSVMLWYSFSYAQCTLTISSFPYNEDFEAGAGGWTSGGTFNDWALGTPSKAHITTAGSGTKCWVTGGLTGSFYSYGEKSYVVSPCFNFTNLVNPHIKFKIYWEGENQYDGTVLQYSLNNGNTWNNVGTNNDPVDCLNQNWFNQSNITGLGTMATPKQGWAGTITNPGGGCFGGGGSNGWLTAQHCMSYLGGQPSVMFRFAFGAGTTCNDFDGVAFDKITIEEAPLSTADYTYHCNGSNLGYDFNATATCAVSYTWNFDDPLSGAANSSNLISPSHSFTAPGTYHVSVVVTGPCNTTTTVIKQINTLDLNISTTNLLCYGVNIGTINAIPVNSGSSVQTFTLQPNNITNTTGYFNNLAATLYDIFYINSANCAIDKAVSIYSPTALVFTSLTSSAVACSGQSNASISALVNGGTNPKTYYLQPGNLSNTTGNFTSLPGNTYTVSVVDANNCSISSTIVINQTSGITINTFNSQNILCYGAQTGQAIMTINGGFGSMNFQLQPGNLTQSNGNFQNLSAGNYTITATDGNGCTASTAFTLTQSPSISIGNMATTSAKCVPPNSGSLTVTASNGVGLLQYSIGSGFGPSNSFQNILAGLYTVTVQDANLCTVTSTALVPSEPLPVISIASLELPSCSPIGDGSLDIDATSATGIQQYVLQPGNVTNNNGLFAQLTAGIYTVTVADNNGCSSSTTIVLPSPGTMSFASILVDNDSCTFDLYNKVTCLMDGGVDPKVYRVIPGNITNNSGVFYNLTPDHYYMSVTDSKGCSVVQAFEVSANECCNEPIVASAFSPNNDGLNDELHCIHFPGIKIEKFMVVNRFGNVVFTAQHELDRWDGTYHGSPCDVGTYFYMVQYQCNRTKEKGILKGDVTLLR